MISTACALAAALLHIYIFCLESLWWGKPRTNRAFGLDADAARACRAFAFNQGFYNLFLAAAVGAGFWFAPLLTDYALLSMVGAAIVLGSSQPKLWRAALVQGGPPFLALFLRWTTGS